jgi:hypothetical protein
VTSIVLAVGGRSRTAAIVAAPCFSAQGDEVVAKTTASARPASPMASDAFTASVRLSSSWFATAFSPWPVMPPHSAAITCRGRR